MFKPHRTRFHHSEFYNTLVKKKPTKGAQQGQARGANSCSKASRNQIKLPDGLPIWQWGLPRRCKWAVWSPIWLWKSKPMANGATQIEKERNFYFYFILSRVVYKSTIISVKEANRWSFLIFVFSRVTLVSPPCLKLKINNKKLLFWAGYLTDMHTAMSQACLCLTWHADLFVMSVLPTWQLITWQKLTCPF